MIAFSEEVEEIKCGVDVGGDGVAKVGIEIGEAGAVDDQVERIFKPRLRGFVHAEAGLADVAFDDFYFFFEKSAEAPAVLFVKTVERGGFFDNFFEAALGGRGAVAADQQRDLADVGNVFEEIDEPDFADETGYADEENVFTGQGFADGEAVDAGDRAQRGYGAARCGNGMRGRLFGGLQFLRRVRPAETLEEFFAGDAAVNSAGGDPR